MKLSKLTLLLMSLVLVLTLSIFTSGCTSNQRARAFGGTMKIELPKNTKLINATWKTQELWYLIRPMHSNEIAETYEFIEKSSFGVIEGKVVFVESK